MGGDEFCAVLPFQHREKLERFLERLRDRLSEPVSLEGTTVQTDASLGVAIWPDDGADLETLVSNADVAMYEAKNNELQPICFYDAALGEAVRNRVEMVMELRRAVELGGLDMHYQVQRSIQTGRVSGYEALVRWEHPTLGRIPPSDFIPLAEANGLILPLGDRVLWRACSDALRWPEPYRVAVNLSPVQLINPRLPQAIAAILRDTGLPPERLELELTETAVIQDKTRSLEAVQEIKTLGVSIALDDFGTGYSSLDTLHSFPFDRIKLAGAFVDGLGRNPRSLAVVRAVLALGKSHGIPVLAEGVGTPAQPALLRVEACDEAQGNLLGRPGPEVHRAFDEAYAKAG
jgi:diguanylate cyclase